MISSPYEIVSLNVQDGVIDCTEAEYTVRGYGGGFSITNNSAFNILTCSSTSTVLHVKTNDGTVPMVVEEGGYEWVPVYSRKLV